MQVCLDAESHDVNPSYLHHALLANSRLREMRANDIAAIMPIEHASYQYPWSVKNFVSCLKQQAYHCWTIEQQQDILAYLIWSKVVDEAHILNICVEPKVRGRGVASYLLEQLQHCATQHRITTIFLEVRPSNTAAMTCYQRAGFCEIGVRKGYYPDIKSREDAMIMALTL